MKVTPENITEVTKEALVKQLVKVRLKISEMTDHQVVLRQEMLDRLKNDGEIIAGHTVSKAKRVSWKVDMAQAEELGAIKKAVDTAVLKKILDSGVDVPHSVTEYLLIKEIVIPDKVIKKEK